ncbi:MAG: DsbA family protein [marine benthic group bacterium]|nr:DsbA family protein [Gemmatimonadota bacterium]
MSRASLPTYAARVSIRAALLLLCTSLLTPASARTQDAARVVPSEQEVVLQRADRARVKGDSTAPIRIVEISDFQCPYCARFHAESWPTIDSLYVRTGIARYLWISFPNSTHPRAWPAVEAAFCAGAAGRFWAMHDLLFDRSAEWTAALDMTELFTRWAGEIGVDETSFEACLRNDVTAPLQVADYDSAVRSGITSTPFFVVGDSIAIRGAVSTERFRSAVDSVLALRGVEAP